MDISSNRDEQHKPLLSEATLRLGEIHQRLLQSSHELDARCWNRESRKLVATDFGREVGKDEIHWWVYRKDTDVDILRGKTENVLTSAQRLKKDSSKLIARYPSEYEKLVALLVQFAEVHRDDIEALHEYVLWLRDQHPVAPSILWTYRVWGTTRRSIRSLHIDPDVPSAQQLKAQLRSTEVACGLVREGEYTIDAVRREVEHEIGDSLDPEDPAYYQPIRVPTPRVLRQTSFEALGSFAEYFKMLRDSLRNIILDIDKYKEQKDLLISQVFWSRFIRAAKDLPTTETSQWDFKQVLNMWRVPKGEEKAKAKLRFAQLVAGFANANGGAIIVGVTDKVPRQIVGICQDLDLESLLKDMGDVIARYVQYPRNIVHFQQTIVEDDNGAKRNCLVIAIAQACEPVAVMDRTRSYTYPTRVETGLTLAEMNDIQRKKIHLKSDSFDFIQSFDQMLHDK